MERDIRFVVASMMPIVLMGGVVADVHNY